MKKFKFSFQAVLTKREQEEKASLRELAVQVAKLNTLYEEEQKVRANLSAWQENLKHSSHQSGTTTHQSEEQGIRPRMPALLRSSMQDFLRELKEKIITVKETVQIHQKKVLKQRQETQKMEKLREQQLKVWKRTKNRTEQLELEEQSLQKYILEGMAKEI